MSFTNLLSFFIKLQSVTKCHAPASFTTTREPYTSVTTTVAPFDIYPPSVTTSSLFPAIQRHSGGTKVACGGSGLPDEFVTGIGGREALAVIFDRGHDDFVEQLRLREITDEKEPEDDSQEECPAHGMTGGHEISVARPFPDQAEEKS